MLILQLICAVSPEIREKIESKVGKAIEKFGTDALFCHVTLKVNKNPEGEYHNSMKKDSHMGEVSVFMKGGSVIKVSEASGEMETTGTTTTVSIYIYSMLTFVIYYLFSLSLFSRLGVAYISREFEETQGEDCES